MRMFYRKICSNGFSVGSSLSEALSLGNKTPPVSGLNTKTYRFVQFSAQDEVVKRLMALLPVLVSARPG